VPFDAHARRSLPFIEPLTLKARRNPFDNPDWLFELKHDGFRGVLYFERKRGAQLVSRHGRTFGQRRIFRWARGASMRVPKAKIACRHSATPSLPDVVLSRPQASTSGRRAGPASSLTRSCQRGAPLFAFAGLWENWRERQAGAEWTRTCAIITGPPNEVMAELHDRMPAILPAEAWPA
jgi:SOS response associated peptidase (SRAP)